MKEQIIASHRSLGNNLFKAEAPSFLLIGLLWCFFSALALHGIALYILDKNKTSYAFLASTIIIFASNVIFHDFFLGFYAHLIIAALEFFVIFQTHKKVSHKLEQDNNNNIVPAYARGFQQVDPKQLFEVPGWAYHGEQLPWEDQMKKERVEEVYDKIITKLVGALNYRWKILLRIVGAPKEQTYLSFERQPGLFERIRNYYSVKISNKIKFNEHYSSHFRIRLTNQLELFFIFLVSTCAAYLCAEFHTWEFGLAVLGVTFAISQPSWLSSRNLNNRVYSTLLRWDYVLSCIYYYAKPKPFIIAIITMPLKFFRKKETDKVEKNVYLSIAEVTGNITIALLPLDLALNFFSDKTYSQMFLDFSLENFMVVIMTYVLTFILCAAYGNSILRNRQIGQTTESQKGMVLTWIGATFGVAMYFYFSINAMDTTLATLSDIITSSKSTLQAYQIPLGELI